MFSAATNTNKFCIATGGPVLAGSEHVTGGLVAARCLAAACDWVSGPRGRLYQLFTHFFFYFAPGLVAAPGIRKVYSCARCWHFERFLTQGNLVKILHFSFFSLHHWCKALRQEGPR